MERILVALWAYRGFILGSVRREFQAKYLNSLLGVAWAVINPLAQIVIFTVIFANVMRAKLPGVDSTYGYSIHLCAGLLTWNLFAEIAGRGQTVFIENANLLKKISFPRLSLPVIVVINALLNFAIVFGLFTVFLLVSGNFPGLPFIALLPLLLIETAFAIGVGITLGVLNVFFRDIGQAFGVVLQFWFWLTPIVYAKDILPAKIQFALSFNPMAGLIAGFQDIMVKGEWPDWRSLWLVTLLAVLLCLWGFRLFRRNSGDMVDEL